MSDTPRTDAKDWMWSPAWAHPGQPLVEEERVVDAKFARELERELADANARIAELVAERDNLKHRVANLNSQNVRLHYEMEENPPADRDRDLREQLVVAVYPILLAVAWGRPSGNTTAEEMADTLAAMRELAIVEADKMIAAMRKGER